MSRIKVLYLLIAAGLLLFPSRPAAGAKVNEFPTYSVGPMYITAGTDGNLWFTEGSGNKIGRITPAGVVTEFTVPTAGSYPAVIAADPDGNLWFTENAGNKIGKITAAGVFTEYPVTTANSGPWGIVYGPDGNLWFTENTGNKIGKISPTDGTVTEYSVITASSGPSDIAVGSDGNLWFTENTGNKIGKITTAGAVSEFDIPTANSGPLGIAAGPDGNLWFTENAGNNIGRLSNISSPTPSFDEYTIPTSGSQPWGIAVGPDGNLWFAENFWSKIGEVTNLTGTVTVTEVQDLGIFSQPMGLASGPDGNLWFTEANAGRIGQLLLATGSAHTVTPSAGLNGSISPNTPQTVDYGLNTSFTVTADTGYHISSVTGCGGTLSGSTYTTGWITADCTVSASFAINTYTVTPVAGPNGSISPDTAQLVDYNATAQFTVTPDAGSAISSVTGCGGSLAGSIYTTAPMTANCTVTATFSVIPPTASFTGSPLTGPAPLAVSFTDTSANSPTSWSWTFGDGGTSTLQNPSHTYQNGGTYSVSLTASNAGGSDTATMTDYVTASCPVLSVRIAGASPAYFSSLQAGYGAASSGDVIQMQDTTLTEAPDLSNGTTVTIKGGYDQCYTTNSGTWTTINGSLTISTGTATVENVVIQ